MTILRRSSSPLLTLASLIGLLCLSACPAQTPAPSNAQDKQGGTKDSAAINKDGADESQDDRIVRDTDDLYVDGAPSSPIKAPAGRPIGQGIPDESNGQCRLYSPKHPEPACCPRVLGFNEAKAREFCGLPMYMGESFHITCGYYFMKDTKSDPVVARLSPMNHNSIEDAANAHVSQIRRLYNLPEYKTQAMPGAERAKWAHREGKNWAFLPSEAGFERARLLTWSDDFCSMDGMSKLVNYLIEADIPKKEAKRDALLPLAKPAKKN